MGSLTKQQIIDAKDLDFEKVEVPEWGEGAFVMVHVIPSGELNEWQAEINAAKERGDHAFLKNYEAKLAAMTIRDEHGVRMFSDAETSDLGAKSSVVIGRISDVAMRINHIGPDEVEELAGNSDAASSGDSDSSSHLPLASPASG